MKKVIVCLIFLLPDGNEIGANNLWEPGGKTSGGINEAVMDFSNSPNYTEIIIE